MFVALSPARLQCCVTFRDIRQPGAQQATCLRVPPYHSSTTSSPPYTLHHARQCHSHLISDVGHSCFRPGLPMAPSGPRIRDIMIVHPVYPFPFHSTIYTC